MRVPSAAAADPLLNTFMLGFGLCMCACGIRTCDVYALPPPPLRYAVYTASWAVLHGPQALQGWGVLGGRQAFFYQAAVPLLRCCNATAREPLLIMAARCQSGPEQAALHMCYTDLRGMSRCSNRINTRL